MSNGPLTGATFAPSGKVFRLDWADDSTEVSLQVPAATALQVLSSGPCVVNVGFTDGDTDAVFPIADGMEGKGFACPGPVQVVAIPQATTTSTMWISVAGPSTGSLYFSLGALV